jgi:hypothetical protein
MSSGVSFLQDVLKHFEEFARAAGINPEDVYVRLTLADGSAFVVRGLKVTTSPPAQNWGMIEGLGKRSGGALVIREAHVVKVEFEPTPKARQPIGLHTEGANG